MRKINIEITKARLAGFTASFENDGENDVLQLSANLDLMTEQGEKVSSYTMNTRSYYDNKFNIPISVYEPIFKIAEELEVIVTRQCRSHHLALTAPQND